MDFSQNTANNVAPYKKGSGSRRVWTRPEEEVLILGLKDLIEKGWKSDNSFRVGYLKELEAFIRAQFPSTSITGSKHITSKLTVWKKTYGQVSGMQRTSGFGFDEQKNMVTCEDDVWENYVRVHPEVDNMRFKSFPYYRDWEEIFGKDRATGDDAQNLHDAVLDLLHPHLNGARMDHREPCLVSKGKRAPGEPSRGHGDGGFDMCDENDVDTTSVTHDTIDNDKNKEKKKGKKKRKHGETDPEPMITMLGTFLERNNVAIEAVAARIAAKQAEAAASIDKDTLVFQTVSNINGLPHDLKIFASFKIIEMKKTALFLGMDQESQTTFVQMVLEGKLGK